jgi:hypothetical protein
MRTIDTQALKRCVEIASREPGYAAHLKDLLKERAWIEVAVTACYHVQSHALRLRPWQEPPCVVSEDGPERDSVAQALLRKMLAAGVSRYEPDPLAATRSAANKPKSRAENH